MGIFDKATELVGGAGHLVGGALPDVDLRKLREVVDLVWNNKDELIDLLTRLPTLLGDAGEQMQTAGAGAHVASSLLANEVLALTTEAADTLDTLRWPLTQVAEVLREMGTMLDRVPLLGNVTAPVTRGLGALGEVSDGIGSVSNQIRGLGLKLADVGVGLDAMGVSLQGGGAALTAVSGRRLAGAVARSARSAATATAARPSPTPGPSTAAPPARRTTAPRATPPKPAAKKVDAPKAGATKAVGQRAASTKSTTAKAAARTTRSTKAGPTKPPAKTSRARK